MDFRKRAKKLYEKNFGVYASLIDSMAEDAIEKNKEPTQDSVSKSIDEFVKGTGFLKESEDVIIEFVMYAIDEKNIVEDSTAFGYVSTIVAYYCNEHKHYSPVLKTMAYKISHLSEMTLLKGLLEVFVNG